jgi:hypothetical protein
MSRWKVGILFLDFHFPTAVVRRGCGNVRIAGCAIRKVLVDGVGNLFLVFLTIHSPSFPQLFPVMRFSFARNR